MGNIERWDVFICPSCGTLYPDLSTLCECELPNNIDGVETERVTVVPASQLAGAVDAETLERHRWALDAAVRFITDNGGNPDVVKSLLVLAEWGQ